MPLTTVIPGGEGALVPGCRIVPSGPGPGSCSDLSPRIMPYLLAKIHAIVVVSSRQVNTRNWVTLVRPLCQVTARSNALSILSLSHASFGAMFNSEWMRLHASSTRGMCMLASDQITPGGLAWSVNMSQNRVLSGFVGWFVPSSVDRGCRLGRLFSHAYGTARTSCLLSPTRFGTTARHAACGGHARTALTR